MRGLTRAAVALLCTAASGCLCSDGHMLDASSDSDASSDRAKLCFFHNEIDGGVAPEGRYRVDLVSKTWIDRPWYSEIGDEYRVLEYEVFYPPFLFFGNRLGVYRAHFDTRDAGANAEDAGRASWNDMLWIERGTGVVRAEQLALSENLHVNPAVPPTWATPIPCQTGNGFIVEKGTRWTDGGIVHEYQRIQLDGAVVGEPMAFEFSGGPVYCRCVGEHCFIFGLSESYTIGRGYSPEDSLIDDWPTDCYSSSFNRGVLFAQYNIATEDPFFPTTPVSVLLPNSSQPSLRFGLAGFSPGQIGEYCDDYGGNGGVVQYGQGAYFLGYSFDRSRRADYLAGESAMRAIVKVEIGESRQDVVGAYCVEDRVYNLQKNSVGLVMKKERWEPTDPGLLPGGFTEYKASESLLFFDFDLTYIAEMPFVSLDQPQSLFVGHDLCYMGSYSWIVPDGDGFIVYYIVGSGGLEGMAGPAECYPSWPEKNGFGVLRYRVVDTWADAGRDAGALQ